VLYACDTKKIKEESGGKVRARVRPDPYGPGRGKKKLQLIWEGDDIDHDVKMKAKETALNLIYYNQAHPPGGTSTRYVAIHPGNRPPPCTSDEYVEDPDEKNIRVVLHGPRPIMTNEMTGMPPPEGYDGPLHRVEVVGPRHGKGCGKDGKRK